MPSDSIWLAWISFLGPLALIAIQVIVLWFGARIRGSFVRRAAMRDFPRMRVVVRDPFGRMR